MAQKVQLKRGLEANRSGVTPDVGELLLTTDNYEVFIGDNSTAGGLEIGYLNKRTGGTVAGNVAISGNLTVSGTTTTTTSNDVVIGDSIIVLNNNSAATPVDNAGFEIERGDSTNVSLLWNEGTDVWELNDGVSSRRILDTSDIAVNSDYSLSGLSDTTITSNTTGEILKWNGSKWINNTLSEAGIQASDGDLDAIAAIAGTSGLLKKTAANTWTLDTTTYGTITNVSAGSGLTGGGTSGTVTLNVGAGTAITVGADTIGVTANGITSTELDVADNGASGNVLTSDGSGGFTWESAGAATNNALVSFAGSGGITTSLGDINLNQATDETITIAHLTTDGNKHVPATSTTNNNKVLTAGSTAGAFSWQAPQQVSTDVTLAAVTNNYLSLSGQTITAGVVPISLGGTGATSASDARTALDVDQAGTDNSTNVTLSGTKNYLTISGQVITMGVIDISDDTNLAVDSSLLLTGDTLSVNEIDGGTF